jgi:hypothetical protein
MIAITLGADRNHTLIDCNSCENPELHSLKGMSTPGKKSPPAVSLYCFSFRSYSQQAEDRAPNRINLCDVLDH